MIKLDEHTNRIMLVLFNSGHSFIRISHATSIKSNFHTSFIISFSRFESWSYSSFHMLNRCLGLYRLQINGIGRIRSMIFECLVGSLWWSGASVFMIRCKEPIQFVVKSKLHSLKIAGTNQSIKQAFKMLIIHSRGHVHTGWCLMEIVQPHIKSSWLISLCPESDHFIYEWSALCYVYSFAYCWSMVLNFSVSLIKHGSLSAGCEVASEDKWSNTTTSTM